jgi:hypothetical protein
MGIQVNNGSWTLTRQGHGNVPMTVSSATASGFRYSIGNGGPQNQTATESGDNNAISINVGGGVTLSGFVCSATTLSADCSAGPEETPPTWEAEFNPGVDEEYKK